MVHKKNTNKIKDPQYNQQLKNIFTKSILNKSIQLSINNIGKNIKQTIEQVLIQDYEGKCDVDGYIKIGSIRVLSHSCGIVSGSTILFNIVFECDIYFPVEGMLIDCIVKNITKAGIRAESIDISPSPFVVFIVRDHQYMDTHFSSIKENEPITIRVIGQRFELNDKYISIIGEVISKK